MDPVPAFEGMPFTIDGHPFTVGPACELNQGRWFCVTHSEAFLSQLDKDGHISDGEHVLTWVCFTHGPEVP